MATTGRLGTAASQPGNLQPGTIGVPAIVYVQAAGTAVGGGTAAATLIRVGTLAGTATGGATAAGTLRRVLAIQGAAAGIAAAQGTANTGAHLQATASGGATATGLLRGILRMVGAAMGGGTTRAALSGSTHAAGTAAGGASVAATLNRYKYATGNAAAGSGSLSGSLTLGLKLLAGTTRGMGTLTGALTGVAHAVTFFEVEIPAFYVDGLSMVASTSPAIVNLIPDLDVGLGMGPPAAGDTWIDVDFIDFGTDGIDGGQTRIVINGVDAMVAGVTQAGFEGALASPSADTKHARVRPLVAFSSSQTVTVTASTALVGGSLVSRTWSFGVADTIPPSVYGARVVEQTRVRITWDEEVTLTALAGGALNPAAYTLTYVQTDPLVPAVTPVVIGVEAVTAAGTSPTIIDLITDVSLTAGVTYLVTAIGVADVADNVRSISALAFDAPPLPRPDNRDFDLWRMLPRMNRDEDATGDLRRFIACLQEVTDVLLYDVDRFVDVFDPDIAPEPFVDAMLADLGNPFPFVLDLVKKRQLVKLLVPLYKQKGTRAGILAAIRFFVELEVTITTYTGTDMRLGLSRLGEDWILGPGNSFALYAFVIVSPVTLNDEERSMISFIANYMRTAHEHLVRIQEPTAPIPPDDPMVLGSSQLGGANGLEWLLH